VSVEKLRENEYATFSTFLIYQSTLLIALLDQWRRRGANYT